MSVCQAQNTAVTPDEFQTNSVTLCEVSQKNTCKLIRHERDQHVGGVLVQPRCVQAAGWLAPTRRRRYPALINAVGWILPRENGILNKMQTETEREERGGGGVREG